MPPDGASAWERVRALLGGGARAVARPDPGGEYGPEAEVFNPHQVETISK